MKTKSQAIKELKELIDLGDPNEMHSRADHILLEYVNKEVADAYNEVVDSASWWVTA